MTPHQTDILNRCRAYLGDFSRGFGGSGSCIFNIRYPFVTGDPCFSVSDTAWRVFGGLGRDELTYTFPYAKLIEIADQIKPTADYINSYSPPLRVNVIGVGLRYHIVIYKFLFLEIPFIIPNIAFFDP